MVPLFADRDYSAQTAVLQGHDLQRLLRRPQDPRLAVHRRAVRPRSLPDLHACWSAVGFVMCVIRAPRSEAARALLGAWTFTLLLFFGRTNVGLARERAARQRRSPDAPVHERRRSRRHFARGCRTGRRSRNGPASRLTRGFGLVHRAAREAGRRLGRGGGRDRRSCSRRRGPSARTTTSIDETLIPSQRAYEALRRRQLRVPGPRGRAARRRPRVRGHARQLGRELPDWFGAGVSRSSRTTTPTRSGIRTARSSRSRPTSTRASRRRSPRSTRSST